jgi:hypothetical protein
MIGSFLMKKYITISLLLFVPFMSMAADHCTNQSEYTVDKRCYVTNDQKKQKPYNAVAGIYDIFGRIVCSGTIVKWNRALTSKDFVGYGDMLYFITAKHCSDADFNEIPDEKLDIKLQNGDKISVTLVEVGNYDLANDNNLDGDWAIYRLPVDMIRDIHGQYHINVISVQNMENKFPWIYADANGYHDGRLIRNIGYGTLKIMSDKEIEEFKQRYIDYLQKEGITNISEENTGIEADGGIYVLHDRASSFKHKLQSGVFSSWYLKNLVEDRTLKVSSCFFKEPNRCQSWSGNSGGPFIDRSNKLCGILTRGTSRIGGPNHASTTVDDLIENPGEKTSIATEYIYNKINKR